MSDWYMAGEVLAGFILFCVGVVGVMSLYAWLDKKRGKGG